MKIPDLVGINKFGVMSLFYRNRISDLSFKSPSSLKNAIPLSLSPLGVAKKGKKKPPSLFLCLSSKEERERVNAGKRCVASSSRQMALVFGNGVLRKRHLSLSLSLQNQNFVRLFRRGRERRWVGEVWEWKLFWTTTLSSVFVNCQLCPWLMDGTEI